MTLPRLLLPLTAGVTVIPDEFSDPDIDPGSEADGIAPIRVIYDSSLACGQDVQFQVTIGWDGGFRPDSCTLTIPADCLPC